MIILGVSIDSSRKLGMKAEKKRPAMKAKLMT
jgi:hypothetical protein